VSSLHVSLVCLISDYGLSLGLHLVHQKVDLVEILLGHHVLRDITYLSFLPLLILRLEQPIELYAHLVLDAGYLLVQALVSPYTHAMHPGHLSLLVVRPVLVVPRVPLPRIVIVWLRAGQEDRLGEGLPRRVVDLHVDTDWGFCVRQDRGLVRVFSGFGFQLSEELVVDVQ